MCLPNLSSTTKNMRWFRDQILGVVATIPGREVGDYTLLPARSTRQWIRTADLFLTREEAEIAPNAIVK